MASAIVTVGDFTVRVGALAVVNAAGCAVDPRSGAPWVDHPAVRRPTADDRRAWRAWVHEQHAERQALNTTIGVVATDAVLDRAEAGRVAMAAHDGLARAIRPAHALTDGDAVFALATGDVALPDDHDGLVRTARSRVQYLNAIAAASAEVFALACTDAIVNASSLGRAPAYVDLCPGARRP
jgi:L-aminopeptidase/D-esterase-like protein